MSYPREILGDYIDVLSGFAFKSKDFSDSGVPVIKIKNISPPVVTLEDISYVSESIAFQNPRYILKKGDVLIALTGSHINQIASVVGRVGRVRYNETSVLNQRVGKIINKNDKISCLDYIYYYLSQFDVKVELAQKAGGAANQANISPSDIKDLLFPCPNIEVQRRIAEVLSRYDSLIENYQRQIKLLEEAAQRLYKEWFVDLRFPGHESTPIINGIPVGWQKKKLADFADILMGQSPKSEFYNKEQQGLPFHQGVGSYGYRFVIDDIYSSSLTRVAEPNSILFSVRAPVGRLNITKNRIVIGRGIAAINHKQGYQSYLYYLLKERFFKDNIIGNGAIFASISKDDLYNLSFLIPRNHLIQRFDELSSNYDKVIMCLDNKIRHLSEARDRLLPKMMNGEIEV
jgi:type I restriction enzyme S subunit